MRKKGMYDSQIEWLVLEKYEVKVKVWSYSAFANPFPKYYTHSVYEILGPFTRPLHFLWVTVVYQEKLYANCNNTKIRIIPIIKSDTK